MTYDRDVNAAMNLKRLATVTALPAATNGVTYSTGQTNVRLGGKATPVRDEAIPVSLSLAASGHEEISDHHRAPSV